MDGRIRTIAVGNVFRRLASMVGCSAVTPSLARQLSPTQIGVGFHCASEAAVHAMRRYVIDHTESGKSHQNRLILRLDLKNAFNTVRRDHLLTVCSELATPIARLAHLAYSSPPIARLAHLAYSSPPIARLAHLAHSSPSSVLTSDHPFCSATGIQQGDHLGPVLFSMAVEEVASSLSSEINIWHLDDATLVGAAESVFAEVRKCVTELKKIGLEVNSSSMKLFTLATQLTNSQS